MIYRSDDHRLWDSWILPYKGQFHLFHLQTDYTNGYEYDENGYRTIGRAVSEDLIHWKKLEPIPVITDEDDAWNNTIAYTGCTVFDGTRFYLYITCPHNEYSVLGAFVSDDLIKWQRVSKLPQIIPGGPYLKKEVGKIADWRDIDIIYGPDGRYHGAVTARMPDFSCDDSGAAIAHLVSDDLINWDYLLPFYKAKQFRHVEVPGLFSMNGWNYITFNTTSLGGFRINTVQREETGGTYYLKYITVNITAAKRIYQLSYFECAIQ
jgi:sucrose-6-phosphate hydrolase SacC (GH32 family)